MKALTEQAFLDAYDTYADAIFRFCYAQTGNREVAKDATQEAFVRTWKYVASGKKIDQMRPFLYRAARNILIDQHRRKKADSLDTLAAAGFDVADERSGPAVAAEVALMLRYIGQLEPKYREAVTLRYVDEMQPREIAAVIGAKENVVSVRIHRGLEKLRERMQNSHE